MEPRASEARMEWRERPIVRVEGTVMFRGELGFTPHLGCGYSRVAIFENVTQTEYLLYGYKLHDKQVTLNYRIPRRMPFTIASPIFHHWVIGDQKIGLSFNGTADARSFDRGVRVVLENLEKAASLSASGSITSDEPNSASPTSTQSFTLPDDSPSSDSQTNATPSPSTRQPPVLPRQNTSNTLPHTFRPQAMSASSRRRPAQQPSRQRRHSSSIPGRPHPAISAPVQPTSSAGVAYLAELPVSSTVACNLSSTTDTPSKHKKDKDKEKAQDNVAARASDTESSHHSNRRHRSRHHTDSSSHHRSRRTKTPNLDHLERRRDLQPTKPNSYVQIASSGNPALVPGARTGISFTRSGYSRTDDMHLSYAVRYPPQRSGARSSYEYRYHGVKSSDDSHSDFYAKTLFHQQGSSFSSFSDANSILKQPSLHKGKDLGKYKEDFGERSRCKHCQIMFNHDRNPPGSCPDAPMDNCEKCIEGATCLCAAHCVFYCCFRDSEGDYDQEPCTCSRSRYTAYSRRRRWLVLGLMSIFLPCLCLYPVLKSCHRCGVTHHCCGGRHEGVVLSNENPDRSTSRC